MVTITIERRFCGPDGSANGGYTCGVLAQHVGQSAEVTLRVPPPLERPLRVEPDGAIRLHDGERVVAEAVLAELDLNPPRRVEFAEAAEAALPHGDPESPFPHCFVCGRDRLPADGLRIFAGRVAGTELVAAPWIPQGELCRPEFVWAALDCPGAYASGAMIGRGVALLGRLAARVDRVPRAGERCVVVGWPLGQDGRKHYAGTALLGDRGDLIGVARATWIVPTSAHD
jgi:hypothetical protein